jgi:hypothetical protein
MYASDVRRGNTWNKNGVLWSDHKPMFVEKEPTLLREHLFPPVPCATTSRTPGFKQAARANWCHKTAIGLYNAGV